MTIRCVLFLLGMWSCRATTAGDSFHVYATDSQNQQVLSISVRTIQQGVSASTNDPLPISFAATSICLHPGGRQLFLSSSRSDATGHSPAARVDVLDDGGLRFVKTAALTEPTGYTSIDRTGRYFLFANYRSGTIGSCRIDQASGGFENVCVLKTPRPEAHCIRTTPDNRFVYVPCVKTNNAIFQYAFNEKTGQLMPLSPHDAEPPAMFGPRHVAYHPTLPIAYFSNEQQLGVSVYEIRSDGQLTDRQHATTIPRRSPFEQGKRDLHASDLVITPDGKQLFVAVRDFNGDEDSLFSFRVESDGKLSLTARTRVGDIPWKLGLSPNARHLLVSESGDQALAVFAIQSTGQLSRVAKVNWGASIRDMVVVGTPGN